MKTLYFKSLVWNSPHFTLPVDYCLKERGSSWQAINLSPIVILIYSNYLLLIPLWISGHITLFTSVKVTRGKVLREKRAGAAFRKEPWREEWMLGEWQRSSDCKDGKVMRGWCPELLKTPRLVHLSLCCLCPSLLEFCPLHINTSISGQTPVKSHFKAHFMKGWSSIPVFHCDPRSVFRIRFRQFWNTHPSVCCDLSYLCFLWLAF